jgi:ketosteroid isomerase-like protein
MRIQLVQLSLALGLVAALLIGCQPIQPITLEATNDEVANDEETEAEFLDAVMAIEAAYQSEDAVHAASFYTEDALSMPPGYPPSHGREAIQSDLKFFYGSFDLERDFELADYKIVGDTATRTATWTQTLTPTDGSDPIVETGRCVLGFEKVDDEWKVAWEIWNTFEQ